MRAGEHPLKLGPPKQQALLAVLLLHANEVVSTDRLVDSLWGEAAPNTAATAVHGYVSGLRKALGDHGGRLATAPRGYTLRIEPGELDLDRFERALDSGREQLAADGPGRAAETLRAGLALWRGRPLAGFEDEPFAREAVARLEELRIQAREELITAELERGAAAELVAELRSLVSEHPFRERFRAQLMLALYRAGRQAEALATYDDARRAMVDELGLEPGPALRDLQRAILEHDPALAGPARRQAPGRPRRRRFALAAAGAAAVAAAAGAAALWLPARGDDAAGATARAGNALVLLDPRSGDVREAVAVGATPVAVALGEGAAWVVNADAQTLSRVDAETRETTTFATGGTPTDIAAGYGSVWVGDGEPLRSAQFAGLLTTAVARLDRATRTVRERVRLPRPSGAVSYFAEHRIALGAGAAWAIGPDYSVTRVDPRTTRAVATLHGVRAVAVAAGDGQVWVLGEDRTVARIDPVRNRLTRRVRLPATSVSALAVGEGAVWVTAPADGTLWRIERHGALTPAAIPVGTGVDEVAVGAGAVWVTNPLHGTVVRVDPTANAVTRTVRLGNTPRAVAVDGTGVWVAVDRGGGAATSSAASGDALPESICEPVLSGGARPDFLIASDLPLQGGLRLPARQMADAIAFVLRRHGFRAGRFTVGYQSCDDSVARTGNFDVDKCAANAREYVRNRRVLGVVGTFNSPCAAAALPILNRASLAMVSPVNSYVGLTRAGIGTPPGELTRLYPTGRRTYARVFPVDHLQGAALATVARDRGARRAVVLHDGDPYYGRLNALAFRLAARRLGIDVASFGRWDPHARGYPQLTDRVAAAAPDAVFLGGILDNNGGAVIRALRRRLGADVILLAPDGFAFDLLLDRVGGAASGMYVSSTGVTLDSAGPVARRFARDFAVTQAGSPVDPSALYAAQAIDVLLDAIARSDGTRPSVARTLLETRVEHGILGSFAFDRNGDPTHTPVTVLRVGSGVDRVVTPSPSLVTP